MVEETPDKAPGVVTAKTGPGENRFRTMLEHGHHPIQTVMWSSSMFITELVGAVGFDSIMIDAQHGAIDSYADVYRMLVALSASQATPVLRIPSNESGMIMKMLDAGMQGIVCPLVNTRSEAEKFVRACRYPPQGNRSLGPNRAAIGSGDYVANANETVMTIAQIETLEALENIEDIVSVPGLDAVFPGPADLSFDAGKEPGVHYEDPLVEDWMRRIIRVAHQAGIWVGLPTGLSRIENIPLILDWDADWVIVGKDSDWLVSGAQQTLTRARDAVRKTVEGERSRAGDAR